MAIVASMMIDNVPHIYGTNADRLAAAAIAVGTVWHETDTSTTFEYDGVSWLAAASGGAAHVLVSGEGAVGASKDREYSGAAATRQKFTWVSGAGPVAIDVQVYGSAAGTSINVCFDAESDAVADANLAQAGGVAVDLQRAYIDADDGWVRFYFASPLERMDFIVDTVTVSDVRVRAV